MVNVDLVGCDKVFKINLIRVHNITLLVFNINFSYQEGDFSYFFDMLTRLRNAALVKARKVKVIRTKLNINIAKILKEEGFIESFEEFGETYLTETGFINKYILIMLKYKGVKQKSYITSLKRISKPGFRVYVNHKNIPRVIGGIGIAVFVKCFLVSLII